MEKSTLTVLITLGVFLVTLFFVVFNFSSNEDSFDFKPSITQGIYGVTVTCMGTHMPNANAKFFLLNSSFKIENRENKEVTSVLTKEDGKYEIYLDEGTYEIDTKEHFLSRVLIEVPGTKEILSQNVVEIRKYDLIKTRVIIQDCTS